MSKYSGLFTLQAQLQNSAAGVWPPLNFNLNNYGNGINNGTAYGGAYSIIFNPTGTRAFVVSYNVDPDVFQYNLTIPYDFSSTPSTGTGDSAGTFTTAFGLTAICFSSNGLNMFLLDFLAPQTLRKYPLSVAYDITTAGAETQSFSTESTGSVNFNPTGTRLYTTSRTKIVKYWDLGTAYDLTTVGAQQTIDLTSFVPESLYSFVFYTDTKININYAIFGTRTANIVTAIPLTVSGDLTTYQSSLITNRNFGVSSYGIDISPDGSVLILGAGSSNAGAINQFSVY